MRNLDGRIAKLEEQIDIAPRVPYQQTALFRYVKTLRQAVDDGRIVERPAEYLNNGCPSLGFPGELHTEQYFIVEQLIPDLAAETGWRSENGYSRPSWLDYRANTIPELIFWLDWLLAAEPDGRG